ncbi:N-acetyltransferase family protein [Sinomonas sp. ASV322]|uniref:GNAT family N-acetyltransferase n=1 Tax=Sinomonas sp. ASV322 TaxID=3041920 RepID=UPI0027DB4277|nr:N-acetyltransferase family protein [Sinomonas sp. ASV322]MDQ4502527.1 N-acetyltransferase family protein [Sinomonas sp. ASV322]
MTSDQLDIRPAGPEDLADVAGIYEHYVLNTVATFEEVPWTVDAWERKLGDLAALGLPFLVADHAGSVRGFAYAAPWRAKPAYRHTVEDTIYLAPDAGGRGWGTVLLGELVAHSARAGMREMIAVIADSATGPSARLHERLGFANAGHLSGVGYKRGRWIDTFLFQRSLA